MRRPAGAAVVVVAFAAAASAASGPRPPDAADDPVAVRFRWSAPADCSAHARAEPADASNARVINFGEEPIRDVEVCAGRRCAALGRERVLSQDEIVTVPLPRVPAAPRALRVRCSVLLPSASG